MPVRPKGTLSANVPSFGCVQELLHGHAMLGSPEISGTYAGDEEAMRRDWRQHGKRLTDAWVRRDRMAMLTRAAAPVAAGEYRLPLGRSAGPGSRPWAWWQFSAPEPRRPGESELACLRRLGLLTDHEEETLR